MTLVKTCFCFSLQLIGGLADEKVRWAESVAQFDEMLVNIVGDVMIASGSVAYLGAFTVSTTAAEQLISRHWACTGAAYININALNTVFQLNCM